MQVLVVGAGVVGLSVARAAAIAGHDVVVAEAASGIGTGVSSRNSEVIHAGLYYPTGSRRAYYCPRGRRMLYEFCASHGVPHRKCGKLVVATNAREIERLAAIYKQAQLNGVEGVEIIDAAAAKHLEPALACVAAMHSPETGIIDSHRYMLALRGDLEDRGGMIAFNSPIERLRPARGGWQAAVGGSEPQWLSFDAVVNCAGLGAQRLARTTEGYPSERVPRLVLAKGNYFGFSGRPAFSRLIYPVPVPGGLGALAFYQRIRDYWPGLPDNSLVPDYCGIRPKLTGPGEPAADFMIEGPQQHGLARTVHLFGIESPGLTCSLSIAQDVAHDLSN